MAVPAPFFIVRLKPFLPRVESGESDIPVVTAAQCSDGESLIGAGVIGMKNSKDKADGVDPERNQDIRENRIEMPAGAAHDGNGHIISDRFSVDGMDAGTAVAGMELHVTGLTAGVAADLFKRKIHEGIADQFRIREFQGCERIE